MDIVHAFVDPGNLARGNLIRVILETVMWQEINCGSEFCFRSNLIDMQFDLYKH